MAGAAGAGRVLLDVNVLIALLDDAHLFSARVNAWLDAEPRRVATCPIVENGVVRVMSAPAYSATHRTSAEQVADGPRAMAGGLDHAFWPDDVSLLDHTLFDAARLHGHRQVTDVYLRAPAVRHRGSLATLDGAIALSPVRGATPAHLLQV